jgi:hypothetical protein
MTKRIWTIVVDGQEHKVELIHHWVIGLRRVSVDGQVVHRATEWFTSGNILRVMPILDGQAQVWLVTHATNYSYYLLLGGRPIPNDKERARGITSEQLLASRNLQDLARWLDLARQLGLTYLPLVGTLWGFQHRLVGVIQDRPVTVFLGVRGANNSAMLGINVRYGSTIDLQNATVGIANDPRFNDLTPNSTRRRSDLQMSANNAGIVLPYNKAKIQPDELAQCIRTFVQVVDSHTPPLALDHCEQCKGVTAVRTVLVNKNLMRVCQSCLDKMPDAGLAARRAYQAAPHKLTRGVLAGLGATVVTAPLWAAIVLLLDRVGAFMGLGTFMLVFKAMDWAGTKRTPFSTLIAGILCVPSIVLGTYLTYIWQAWRLGYALVPSNLVKIFEISLTSKLLVLCLFYAAIGVIVAAIQSWVMQRKILSSWFQPKVEIVPGVRS